MQCWKAGEWQLTVERRGYAAPVLALLLLQLTWFFCNGAFLQGALFRMQLRAAEEAAKKVSLGTHPHTGEQLLSPQEVRRLQRQREAQHAQHRRNEELKATRRLQVGGSVGGPLGGACNIDTSWVPRLRNRRSLSQFKVARLTAPDLPHV